MKNFTEQQVFAVLGKLLLSGVILGLGACGGGNNAADAAAPTSAKKADAPVVSNASSVDVSSQSSARSKAATKAPTRVGTGLSGTLSPSDMRARYNMPEKLTGAGQTIAVVSTPGSGDVLKDLNEFSDFYDLAQCTSTNPCFQQVVMAKNDPLASGVHWALETALDVQWVHAIAPNAKILLVIAASGSLPDLMAAVDKAAATEGVVAVSMSWGAQEFAGQVDDIYDGVFKKYPSVIFFASAGNYGNGGVQFFPAVSNYVTGVGGTSISGLGLASAKNEAPWSMGGGGASQFSNMPDYQKALLKDTTKSTMRQVPDVAYNADPSASPVVTRYNGAWYATGGTSSAAPQWAAIAALTAESIQKGKQAAINQKVSGAQDIPSLSQRVAAKGGFNNMLYQSRMQQDKATRFVDITTATQLADGFDSFTGLGVPNVTNLIASF